MVAFPPLARVLVPRPLPMTFVFASTVSAVSLPSAVTVSIVAVIDLTVAFGRSLVFPAADALLDSASMQTASTGIARRIKRFIQPPSCKRTCEQYQIAFTHATR